MSPGSSFLSARADRGLIEQYPGQLQSYGAMYPGMWCGTLKLKGRMALAPTVLLILRLS